MHVEAMRAQSRMHNSGVKVTYHSNLQPASPAKTWAKGVLLLPEVEQNI